MEVYVRHIDESESHYLTKIRFAELDMLIDRLKADGVYHTELGQAFNEISYQFVRDTQDCYMEVLLGRED